MHPGYCRAAPGRSLSTVPALRIDALVKDFNLHFHFHLRFKIHFHFDFVNILHRHDRLDRGEDPHDRLDRGEEATPTKHQDVGHEKANRNESMKVCGPS